MTVRLSVDSMDNVYLRYLFIQDTKLYWIYYRTKLDIVFLV